MSKEKGVLTKIIESVFSALDGQPGVKRFGVKESPDSKSVIASREDLDSDISIQSSAFILAGQPRRAQQSCTRVNLTRTFLHPCLGQTVTMKIENETASVEIWNTDSPTIPSHIPPLTVRFTRETEGWPTRESSIEFLNLSRMSRRFKGEVVEISTVTGETIYEVAPGWQVTLPDIESIGKRLAQLQPFFNEVDPLQIRR